MKKSILVAPALAVLLIGAAGSVGGTVAWFSSASSVEAAADTFQAIALDGNLELTLAAGTGTRKVDNQTIKVGAENKVDRLTHASYDHNADVLFTKSSEDAKGRGVRVVDNWEARSDYDGQGNKIYYAVSWTMTFKYTYATENHAYLFLDPKSTFDTPASGDYAIQQNKLNTVEGFRIAFVGQTTGTTTSSVANKRVWAAKRALSDGCKYIQNSIFTAADGDDISDGTYKNPAQNPDPARLDMTYNSDLIASDYSAKDNSGNYVNKYTEGLPITSDVSSNVGCLGVFNKYNNGAYSEIVIKCVAWFEGTDSTIVSNANTIFNTITANMHFYAREYKPAA